MSLLLSALQRWRALHDAARREFLRDPNVILFERASASAASRDGAHGR
ncbi:hypothetical protein ACFOKF_21245 [Sphingobium rhizovicinum]|uniref:Uncharacterized protein n=1 Tax=Sphingobium rhizovicinum TaxID=432308 RepID=A0ABV7NJL3_9SPHN